MIYSTTNVKWHTFRLEYKYVSVIAQHLISLHKENDFMLQKLKQGIKWLSHVYHRIFIWCTCTCHVLLFGGVWVCIYWCFTSHATIFRLYMWRHRCSGGLKKKLYLRSGSRRHRHFVGFFNVPVLHRHGATLFIRLFRHTAPLSHLLRHAGDTEDVISTKTPGVLTGGGGLFGGILEQDKSDSVYVAVVINTVV